VVIVTALTTAACAADTAVQFSAITAARDDTVTGPLTALGPKWAATIGGTAIPAGQLVELHQVGQPRPPLPVNRPHLLFVNGDRWPGSVADVKSDRVRFQPEFGLKQELSIPLNTLSVLWLNPPRTGDERDPLDAVWLAAKRPHDQVRLINRDTLSGTLLSVDQSSVTVEDARRPMTAPRDRVVAIALNSELAKAATPKAPYARAVLTTGARLTLTEALVQDGRLVGKTSAGVTVRLLLGDVVSLTIHGGAAVALGELEAHRYEHTPFLGVRWPFTVDHSTAGGPLQIGADTFDRGIGLHSQSRLTYRLPSGATRFEAWLGIDAAGRIGQVFASVEVDGRVRFGPSEVKGGQPAQRVVIPLTATVSNLTLVVDFGPAGDVQDHVIWADARLIVARSESTKPPRAGGVK